VNALQFEHVHLRRRAPRRGEAPDLAAGGQDSMAGNDQHRILGYSLADIARGVPCALLTRFLSTKANADLAL
jgi:hypothetical protein